MSQVAAVAEFRKILISNNIRWTQDTEVCHVYGTDWSRRFSGPVLAVVWPRTTAQVALILQQCARLQLQVSVQGGNTGLVGGGVPAATQAAVVLSTQSLREECEVDDRSGTLTASAGFTLAEVQQAAQRVGWHYGVDLAARDTATIGGTVATNAGGVRVVHYGMTRRQLLGVEYVTASGEVVSRLAGLPKDNTGYDLAGLLCGSEGTLAVITRVKLRLHPIAAAGELCLVGVPNLAVASELVYRNRERGLFAAEMFDDAGLQLVCREHDLLPPLAPHPFYLLLEAAELDIPEPWSEHTVVAMDAADVRNLWNLRELLPETVGTLGVVHKMDISVPIAELDNLVAGVRACLPDSAQVIFFGHVGDGNLHVEISGLAADDFDVDEKIVQLVARLAGALSAEHGVGRAKAALLHYTRSNTEIALMRAVKAAWDPQGILNTGVLFA